MEEASVTHLSRPKAIDRIREKMVEAHEGLELLERGVRPLARDPREATTEFVVG